MKKTVVTLLCLLAVTSFAACNSTSDADETQKESSASVTDAAADTAVESAQIANPIKEQDTPDFTEKLGFKVVDYPRKDQLTRCAAIGSLVGEMNFTLPQGTITMRVAKDGGGDVSGVQDNLIATVSDMDVNGVSVTGRSFKDDTSQMLYGWIKDGYIFSLHYKDIDDSTHTIMITEEFVEQIVMEPAEAVW